MGGMVAVALLAIILGVAYQDDNRLDEPRIVGAGTSTSVSGAPADGGQTADGQTADGQTADGQTADGQTADGQTADVIVGPIEGFFPKSGEASACSEPVGVDLVPGFGAELTINGLLIAPEDMNVNLTPEGEISTVITASRSLGHYTFRPDDNCPNGSRLRPVGNVLQVCVYRLSDATQTCTQQTEKIFDAL